MGRAVGFQEQVGAGVDEEGAGGGAHRGDALLLARDRVEPFAADDAVLEIAADGARFEGEPRRFRHGFRFGAVAALEIDGDGKLDGGGDAAQIVEREVARQVFAVLVAEGGGDAPAAGGDRRGAGLGHRAGAARIPDVEQDQGIARHVERAEALGLFCAAHLRLSPHVRHVTRQSLRSRRVATAIQGGSATTSWRAPAPGGRMWSLPSSRPISRPNR